MSTQPLVPLISPHLATQIKAGDNYDYTNLYKTDFLKQQVSQHIFPLQLDNNPYVSINLYINRSKESPDLTKSINYS